MKYFDMQQRLSLQAIGTFIYSGGEKANISFDSFEERENDAYSQLEKELINLCGKDNIIQVVNSIMSYVAVVEDNCFSLGMKAGAALYYQLMNHNFETDV